MRLDNAHSNRLDTSTSEINGVYTFLRAQNADVFEHPLDANRALQLKYVASGATMATVDVLAYPLSR